MSMALSFAVRHRLPSLDLKDVTTVRAVDIDPACFLPSRQDYTAFLQPRLALMVERMLVRLVPCLSHLKDQMCQHLKHAHSKEMATRSDASVFLRYV